MESISEFIVGMGLHDKLFDSALAFALFMLLRWALVKIFLRFPHDKQKEFLWRKAATYCSVFALTFSLAFIWFRDFHSLSTFLGLLSAGLAVALKDPLTNLAGWLFILFRKPFEPGDRVQIGNFAGDVIDIDIFQFTLMESGTSGVSRDIRTGRLVKISNSAVFTESQVNYTKGWFEYIWNAVEVNITFESNWKKAMTILQEIVNAESEDAGKRARETMNKEEGKCMVFDIVLEPQVLAEVGQNGVVLTAVYLCDPRLRRMSSSKVWMRLMEGYAREDDIAFAYSTQRSFSNINEGKQSIRTGVPRTEEHRNPIESVTRQGSPQPGLTGIPPARDA